MDRLVHEFDEEFRLVVADTEPLRDATFALRHDVYCRELGYEPVRADGLERDAHDDRALHYLLAHVPSGAWAGCVRVVLDEAAGLPFEAVFGDVPAARSHGPVGEISRLTVSHIFRQAVRALPDRPRFHPHAVLGLSLTAVAATAEAGLGTAVCMMKPRLAAQLRTYGIRFTPLTGEVSHRGRRALYGMTPLVTCSEVDSELQGVLGMLRAQLR